MDVLASNIEKEQDLKSWLEQLNENGKSDESLNANNRQHHIKTNSRFEFDTILGELDDLEKQFEVDGSDPVEGFQTPRTFSTPNPPPPSIATSSTDLNKSNNPPDMSQALEEFSLINSQLEDVLNDLAGFVGKPSEPVKCPPFAKVKPPPPPVPVKAVKTIPSVEGDAKQTPWSESSISKFENGTSSADVTPVNGSMNNFQQQQFQQAQHQQRQDNAVESPVIQSCVSVQLADDNVMVFCVTNKTTIRDLYKSILNEVIKCNQKYFTLWEVLPDLSMERELEPEQFVLSDVVDHWSKHSNNKILMKFTKLPITPPPNLKGELKGTLHVKTDDKKSWKGYTFLMQPTGLYYYPKGKGKLETSCYLEKQEETRWEVFFGIGWKKKLKAPSEFGFAVKTLGVNADSDKDIKYFCADTEALRTIWTSAIKQLMKKTPSEPSLEVQQNSMNVETPPVFADESNHYSEPYETHHHHRNNLHSRRISNASSCSGRMEAEEGVVTPAAKKFANLPITTETTRYLQSMQATTIPQRQAPIKSLTIEDYSRPIIQKDHSLLMDKNQKNQTCLNEYTPSPFACKTPELVPKSQTKTNAIKTLPKPNKSFCQQGLTAQLSSDLDLPPPPPCMMSQQYQTLPSSAKSRTLPPPPPKRDQSTRLSSMSAEPQATSVQTRNFILNLDRTIGQKRVYGAEGLGRVEMPLPPPPVASEEISYLDLGELPPPPAELLQGLKCMRINPGLFQPTRRWP